MKMNKIRVGRKLYFVVDKFGGEIATTRKTAREIKSKEFTTGDSIILEIPLSEGQQTRLQNMIQELS